MVRAAAGAAAGAASGACLPLAVKQLFVASKLYLYSEPTAYFWQGRLQLIKGQGKKATDSWRRCIELAEERGTRRELALARGLLANQLPEGPEGAKLLGQGREALEQDGATRDIEELDTTS